MRKKKVENKILAISPRQSLIKRINMYFGRELGDEDYPYSTQKTILIREVQDNAIDAITKFNKNGVGRIRVTFNEDSSIEIYDNGIGIPTDISQTSDGQPASELYLAMGVLNAGSNYTEVTDSIGTNGVGGSGTQMLSEYMKIEVYRDKKVYKLDFKQGEPGHFDKKGNFVPLDDLTHLIIERDKRPKEERQLFPTGTKILFKIDNTLLKSPYPYSVADLKERLKGTSFLKEGLTFHIIDNFSQEKEEVIYDFGGGLGHIVDLETSDNLVPIFTIKNQSEFLDDSIRVDKKGTAKNTQITKQITVEAAFTWQNNYEYMLDSYVNTIKTRLGGIHVQAFENALVKVFNEKLQSMRGYLSKNDKLFPNEQDYREGLVVAISVNIPEPEFTAQMKEELGGKKALKEFIKLYTVALETLVNDKKNQANIKIIADKVMSAFKLRIKRKEEIDLSREKKKLERTTTMPVKLVDCEITHDENSELFVCEGDSAASGIKEARNSKYQAVMPVRGKILNALKSSPKSILANQELQDLIKCMDAGFGADYKHSEARYNRFIIATDSDPDGHNIANLLIVACWKLFPEAIKQGNVYRILTPLYIIETDKGTKKERVYYCLNSEERDSILRQLKNKKYTITRAKGLGESGVKALRDTGTNFETRRLQQIKVEDIKRAEEMLEIVMGTEIEPRKKWLEENPVIVESD